MVDQDKIKTARITADTTVRTTIGTLWTVIGGVIGGAVAVTYLYADMQTLKKDVATLTNTVQQMVIQQQAQRDEIRELGWKIGRNP